jgi:hypothetical protein
MVGGNSMAFKSILDPDFKYRNSASTDVRKTFERIRREQRFSDQAAGSSDNEHQGAKVVATIGQRQRVQVQRN